MPNESLVRAARCVIGALDKDDLMLRTAVKDAVDDSTVAELITALTHLALRYRREEKTDDFIRADLQSFIVDNS